MHGGEEDVVVDAVVEVGAPAQHDIAGAAHEFLAGDVDGGQRGRAGRVDGEVGAAEVEPVGDAARDDVREHAGEGVLGERGELLLDTRRDRAVVGGQHRAQRRRVGQVAACLGAEHHGGAGAVELPPPVAVSGVLQGAPGGFEGQQLDRFDAAEGGRRDAVAQRVEGDAREEAAPLRRGGATLVRGVVHGRVPAVGRDLVDGVASAEDVRPERGEIGCLREHAGHADDGDVQRGRRLRLGRLLDSQAGAGGSRAVGQEVGGSFGHRAVQGVDRGGRRTEHGDLAGHEHPLGELPLLVHGGQRTGRVPLHALAGDAEPADVEPFQFLPDLPVRDALLAQLGFEEQVVVAERAGYAAGGVTGRGLQQRGPRRPDHLLLEERLDRSPRHRLLREEIGGAHQHADGSAARGERCGAVSYTHL